MFHVLEKRVAEAFAARIKALYGVDTPTQTEQPKQTSFGEMSLPAAFQLARPLKKAPKAIAAEIVAAAGEIEGVSAIEIAGNGYLNVRFDRGYYAAGLLARAESAATASTEKIIVEHTNINPNKAAHIGHLRNAVLGDTIARVLRDAGEKVQVQNYIDNTGVQVADVVIGFLHMEKKSVAEVREMAKQPRFDYLCWDLYARVTQFYEQDKAKSIVKLLKDAKLKVAGSIQGDAVRVGDVPKHRSENHDAMFALSHRATEFLPRVKSGDVRRVRPLPSDEHEIPDTVIVELSHCGEISSEMFALPRR
jgi:arginyl-tRNA synthetase